jgi:hypothetical protein
MSDAKNLPRPDDAVRVFVSYAREDLHWLNESEPFHLIPFLADSLKRYNVSFWFDRQLRPGDQFKREIDAEIDQSEIALLLVSQNFLNSEFIETREMPRIHARAAEGKMVVVPVLTERCRWQDYPFLSDRQMVPNEPLVRYTRDRAEWSDVKANILDGLKAQVDRIRESRAEAQAQAEAEAARRREAERRAAEQQAARQEAERRAKAVEKKQAGVAAQPAGTAQKQAASSQTKKLEFAEIVFLAAWTIATVVCLFWLREPWLVRIPLASTWGLILAWLPFILGQLWAAFHASDRSENWFVLGVLVIIAPITWGVHFLSTYVDRYWVHIWSAAAPDPILNYGRVFPVMFVGTLIVESDDLRAVYKWPIFIASAAAIVFAPSIVCGWALLVINIAFLGSGIAEMF